MAPLTPNVLSSHLFHFLHMVFVNGLMENVTGVAAERLIQTIQQITFTAAEHKNSAEVLHEQVKKKSDQYRRLSKFGFSYIKAIFLNIEITHVHFLFCKSITLHHGTHITFLFCYCQASLAYISFPLNPMYVNLVLCRS